MPFYRNLNILFLHIPRTGGSSVENFLYPRNGVSPSIDNLHSFPGLGIDLNKHSLQHSTYLEIKEREKYFNIDFSKTKVIAIVRNPYHRILSDLIYFKMIDFDSSPENVESTLNSFLNDGFLYDNHKTPQYKFIVDSDDNVCKEILILHTENLTEEMKTNGFLDFDSKDNTLNSENKNYLYLLTNNSIKRINEFYQIDFETLGYCMLNDVSEIENYDPTINFRTNSNYLHLKKVENKPAKVINEISKSVPTKEEIQNIFDTPIQKSTQKNSFSSNIFETKSQGVIDFKDKKLEFEMLREKRIQELKSKHQEQAKGIPPNIPTNSPLLYDKNKLKESFMQLRGKPNTSFNNKSDINII